MSRKITADYSQRFLLPPSLDEWIGPEHPVRFVRDLVESQRLDELGFRESPGDEGRPHYAPELLLGVWLYGWMERIRSSRGLEKSCLRDVAFLWLTGNHHPDHATLWRFYRDNKAALRRLFKQVVQVAVRAGLVGFALHALDGTKIKTVSSMDKALHRKQLQKQLKKLDEVVDRSMRSTEAAEQQEDASYAMPNEMQDTDARRRKIQEALAELDKAQVDHMHRREPEAKVTKVGKERTLAYNAQAIADQKSDLIVAQDVCTDETDHAQLVPMLETVTGTAGRAADHTVADTGYCAGQPLEEAEKKGFSAIVRMQEEASTKGEFSKSNFSYDRIRDGYVCPRGEFLPLQTKRNPTTTAAYEIATYRCHNQACPARAQCTQDKLGRTIKRTPYDDVLQRYRQKFADAANQERYKARCAIIEHIFGIAKSIDGFRRFTARGLQNALTQWSLLCTVINLRKLLPFWASGRLSLHGG